MKLVSSTSIISLFIITTLLHGSFYQTTVPSASSMAGITGSPPAVLEVWNPDLHSSNITSTSMFPVGSLFTVRVNFTSSERLAGFDVTLNYNIMNGLNMLKAVRTGNELIGGLFDPTNPPAGCGIDVVRNDVDLPSYRIRLVAVIAGPCSVPGTGTLFTITFRVMGTGASFIDVVRTNTFGPEGTSIVGRCPYCANIPFQPIDARFQNSPGIPPVARFDYNPTFPVRGDNVSFTGALSFDPDNSTMPGKGIGRYVWLFGDGTVREGLSQIHEFVYDIIKPAAGNFSVTLIVWDIDSLLPDRLTQIVSVSRGIGHGTSLNWSGYAVSSVPGAVSDVKGSWIVPGIVGACGLVEEHSAFWVGIDGLNSPTVEQTGTDSACINGKPVYFAWYEFFPSPSRTIHKLRIHPGDIVVAEVSLKAGRFNVTIMDITTGKSFTKLHRQTTQLASSAEWIAEAPSSTSGILPLANFGRAKFGQYYTGVPNTCYATVAGTSGPIGSFGSKALMITMLAFDFTVKTDPTALSPDKSSFSVLWMNKGP